jgi:F0F1-type ATP synthase assembly protein I
MLLVACGVFVKWVVDDFTGSRVSPITWLLVVSSVLGFVLAANSALQLSI